MSSKVSRACFLHKTYLHLGIIVIYYIAASISTIYNYVINHLLLQCFCLLFFCSLTIVRFCKILPEAGLPCSYETENQATIEYSLTNILRIQCIKFLSVHVSTSHSICLIVSVCFAPVDDGVLGMLPARW